MRFADLTRRSLLSAAVAGPLFASGAKASPGLGVGGADPRRRALWSLPLSQDALDRVRPGQPGVLRSTFAGYNCEPGETGVDIYNGQTRGLKPFVMGADGRVHLRCLPLADPIRDVRGRLKMIGQARLIAPTQFQPGDLVEVDVAHVSPGWLIAPWTTAEWGWPAGGEIDMEYRPDWCEPKKGLILTEHYPGAATTGLGGVTPLPDVDMSKPHLRSLEWTTDGLTIIARVNGVERRRWPMLWNGKPQIIVCQATAYQPLVGNEALPEISIGRWTHSRAVS